MANCIKEVAKMFGVELGEEFKIKNKVYESTNLYFFCENGLRFSDNNGGVTANSDTLVGLLDGSLEIVKLPFKPKIGQDYWGYDSDWATIEIRWGGDYFDYTGLLVGTVFRTEEEALVNRPERYKEITGKEWEE